jgi:carbonic anhydrase
MAAARSPVITSIGTHSTTTREAHIPIYGFIYDVKTGKIDEVADATAAGKPIA